MLQVAAPIQTRGKGLQRRWRAATPRPCGETPARQDSAGPSEETASGPNEETAPRSASDSVVETGPGPNDGAKRPATSGGTARRQRLRPSEETASGPLVFATGPNGAQ